MILGYDHYRSRKRRRGRGFAVAFVAGVLLVAAVALGAIFRVDRLILRPPGSRHTVAELASLWAQKRYDEMLAASEAILASDPLNAEALRWRGFAAFYRGVSAGSAEEKIPYIDESIACLRRARLVSPLLSAETAYVLGKAYYHRGKYAYDQSIRYLGQSVDAGFVPDDLYQYLGMAHSQLEQWEPALAAFREALEREPTDILLLTIGQTYYQMKHTGEAVEYFLRALNKTEDKTIERQARFKLGGIYLDQGELFKAEEQFSALVKLDPRSADAHYWLGEVASKMNDPVRARSEWRAAFALDNQHVGARLRLFR